MTREEIKQGSEDVIEGNAESEADIVALQRPPTLEPIRGRVVDSQTGLPVEGAEVFLNSPLRDTVDLQVGITDKLGCFSLEGLKLQDAGTLVVRAKGYGLGLWWYPVLEKMLAEEQSNEECSVVFELSPGCRLYGKVLDKQGSSITAGYVCAYPPGRLAPLFMDGRPQQRDSFSCASFFQYARQSEQPEEVIEQLSAYWYASAAPFASIGDSGFFDLSCLPADSEQALIVVANNVRRAVIETVQLQAGEEQEKTLVVERLASLGGRLEPPAGQSPQAYGIWTCQHEPLHLVGPVADVRADLWTPVHPDGSFIMGPLIPDQPARVRVSLREPVGVTRARFYSDEIFMVTPVLGEDNFLLIDLRKPSHFSIK